jgi:hypothetical protein
MTYQVITVSAMAGLVTNFEKAATGLSVLVTQAISDGWQPLGGVAVGNTQSTLEPYLFQAMTHD